MANRLPKAPKRYVSRKDKIARQGFPIRTMTPQQALDFTDSEMKRRNEEAQAEQDRLALQDPALKGKKGGNCNRQACQQPYAIFYNHGTSCFYCASCTLMLNRDTFNARDAERLWGHPMVQVDMDAFQDLQVKAMTPGFKATRQSDHALNLASHYIAEGNVRNS